MVDRAALRAADPPGVRRCPFRRQGHMQRCSEAAAMDRFAPARCATRPGARQRPQLDAEIVGGEVSFEPPSPAFSLNHLVGAAGYGVYVFAPPGRRTVNTEPLPCSLVTVTSPPIMRASLRERARPSPVPPKRC